MFRLLHRGMYCISCLLLFCFFQPGLSDELDRNIEDAYMRVFSAEFGYTLIGVKPFSIDELQYEYLEAHSDIMKKFVESIKITFTNSKNFLLKVLPFGETGYYLELLNRNSVREIISKNPSIKAWIKKKFGNEKEFFLQLEDPKISIYEMLNNEKIIGYFLGYSKSDVDYYIRRSDLGLYLRKPPFVTIANAPFKIYPYFMHTHMPKIVCPPYKAAYKKPIPSKGFTSLEDEWKWIKEVEWNLEEEREVNPPYYIALPFYICRHGGDSEVMREKYKRARVRLANLFCNQSIRKVVAKEAAKQ